MYLFDTSTVAVLFLYHIQNVRSAYETAPYPAEWGRRWWTMIPSKTHDLINRILVLSIVGGFGIITLNLAVEAVNQGEYWALLVMLLALVIMALPLSYIEQTGDADG